MTVLVAPLGSVLAAALYSDVPLYARACDVCGYVEVSDDERLYVEDRECPDCVAAARADRLRRRRERRRRG